MVNLALGLGKTIVDGGISWTYSPAYPKKPPPFASVDEMIRGTQSSSGRSTWASRLPTIRSAKWNTWCARV